MKLNRCFITGFGTFVGEEIVFDEHLHAILEKNGFGKTTLAQFICAMLYGMSNTLKKDNTRERYLPWRGGSYGGSLEIIAGEIIYRIERTFDPSSAKKDKLKFFDIQKPSEEIDLGEKSPGEYLFAINKETFLRTVFHSGTPSGEKSDLIARVSALLNHAEDSGGFEKALLLLAEERKEYKADRGKSGKIDQTKNRISDCTDRLYASIRAEKEYSVLSEELKTAEAEKVSLTDALKVYKEYHTRQEYLKDFEKELLSAKNDLEVFAERFPVLPDDSQFQKIKTLAEEAEKYLPTKDGGLSEEDAQLFRQLSAFFAQKEDVEKKISNIDLLLMEKRNVEQTLSAQKDPRTADFTAHAARFEKNIPSEAEKNELAECYERYRAALRKKNEKLEALTLATAKPPKKEKATRATVLSILTGGTISLIGLVMLLLNRTAAVLLIASGLLILLTPIIYNLLKKEKSENTTTIEYPEITAFKVASAALSEKLEPYGYRTSPPDEGYRTFLEDLQKYLQISEQYHSFLNSCNEKREKISKAEEQIEEFFSSFGYSSPQDKDATVKEIREKYDRYRLLSALSKHAEVRHIENSRTYREKTTAFFNEIADISVDPAGKSIKEIFDEIDSAVRTHAKYKQVLTDAKERAERFLNDHPSLPKPVEDLLPEESEGRLDVLEHEIIELHKCLQNAKTEAEKREKNEKELLGLQGDLKEYLYRYQMISATEELLKKANDELKAEIALPLYERYCNYANAVDPTLAESLTVDIYTLSFLYERAGQLRKIEHFSTGQQAISDLCLRLALVDLIYEKEQPPIILDDPFVHLDGENLKNALRAVKKLSKSRQILYFTCHESRVIS